VDDTGAVRELVMNMLSEAGYSVEGAPDGAKGLALILAREPDIVLLDMEMPVMNGLNVLDVLSKRTHLFSVIMFTTHADSDRICEAFARGADDYIVKPFKDRELLARVAAAERSVSLKRKLDKALKQADASLDRMREAQAQLVEEKKLKAISRLAAGVAHEINNPLGFIQSNLFSLKKYTEFLLNSLDICLSANNSTPNANAPGINIKKLDTIRCDIMPLLEETQHGFERISEIVKGFRKLEHGLYEQRDVLSMDINTLLAELLDDLQPGLPEDVELKRELSSDPLPVMATVVMLNGAFSNLLQNAIEAVDKGGLIRISTKRSGNMICCEICNSGPAMEESVLTSIFDPFFTTRHDTPHLGLGLTIALCFINAHSGTIEVQSSPGEGTTFRVLLPACD